jgi:replicative DNA helicase
MPEHTLPHDASAEAWVLGTLLNDPAQLTGVAAELGPTDFHTAEHTLVWEAMLSLPPDTPASVVTVADALRRAGTFLRLGGTEAAATAYLQALADQSPSSAHLAAAVRIVAEKALRRRLIFMGEDIALMAQDETTDAYTLQGQAEAAVLQLRSQTRRRQSRLLRDIFPELERTYATMAAHPGQLRGLSSGFPSIDGIVQGFRPGQYIIVAARPGFGKSTLMLNIAHHMARSGTPVAVFSLEQPPDQLLHKLVQMESGVPDRAFSEGLTAEQLAAVERAREVLREEVFVINGTTSIDVHAFLSEARRLKLEFNIGALFLDYLGLLRWSGHDRRLAVEEMSRIIKMGAGADDLNMPIFVLSQLSRNTETRADGMPTAADLKETGALEADTDVIMLLWPPDQYLPDHERTGHTKVIIAKNRNGSQGAIWLKNDLGCARFLEPTRQEVSPVAPEPIPARPKKAARHQSRVSVPEPQRAFALAD